MTEIQAVVGEQGFVIIQNPILTSGNKETIILHVEFDETWDSYAKSVVFFNSNDEDAVYEVLLSNGQCIVPHEVLDKPGILSIGARGINASNGSVKTSPLGKCKILKGAPAGCSASVAPTPDIYQQLLTAYDAQDRKILSVADEVDSLSESKISVNKVVREYENNDYILALSYHTQGSDVQSGKSKILMYLSQNGVDFTKVGVLPVEVNANLYDLSVTYHKGQWVIAYDCIDRTYNNWTTENNQYNRGGNRVGVLTTTDFVNYTNRFIDLPAEWKSTWAPEIFVDNDKLYIALTISTCSKTFVNTVGNTRYIKDGIYICELNEDFGLANYTEITLPDDGITPENYIDAAVYNKDGTYYLAIKEENKIIQRLYKSTSLLGGYTMVHEFAEQGEGMAIIKFNGKYYAYSDKYVDAGSISKRGTYLSVSNDMETWSSMVLVNVQGDAYNRHHTPFVVKTEAQKKSIANFVKLSGSIDTSVESFGKKSYLLAQGTEQNVVDRLLLQPNATYYVINASQVTINSVDTSLMNHGDTCRVVLASRNPSAKIVLKYSDSNLLFWGNTQDLIYTVPDGVITICCTHGGSNKYCFTDTSVLQKEATLSFSDGTTLRLLRNNTLVTAMLRGTVDSLSSFTERVQAGVLPTWAIPPVSLTFCGTVLKKASHLGCVMELNVNGDVKYSVDQDISSTWIAVNATYQVI